MTTRQFKRGEKNKYSLEEKAALGELCKKYKKEYDEKSTEMSKMVNWNNKTKKHADRQPTEGFLARAVCEFYPDLKELKHGGGVTGDIQINDTDMHAPLKS